MTEQAINQAFAEKVKRGIFRPVDRFLTDRFRAEDTLQDAVAATWYLYRRKAEEGQVLDDALLVHACRLHAVNPNRTFVPRGAWGTNRDILDPRAYTSGKLELLQYDESMMPMGLAEMGMADPEFKLNSALDLEAWAGNLKEEDRRLMAGKLAGESTRKLAQRFKRRTYKEIWGREKELGRELAERAGIDIDFKRERRGRKKKEASVAR